jgi:hypothetical protein
MYVDAVPRAAKGQFDAMMNQALAMRARAGADLVEQRHGALFEQTGPNAAEHIFRRLALQNHVVNAVKMK